MKTGTVAKYGIIGLALALAGFIGAIGVLTLIFSPRTGAYAPVTSSDAAAWIQAVGSIAAIAAAYWLGERQARKARDQALEVYHLQRRRIDAGALGIVDQLYGEVVILKQNTRSTDFQSFCEQWKGHLRDASQAAIGAFENMPLHELGNAKRVQIGFELRTTLQYTVARIDANVRDIEIATSLSDDEQMEARDTQEKERISTIRKIAAAMLDRQTRLRSEFHQTYGK